MHFSNLRRSLSAIASILVFPTIANAGTFTTIYTFAGGNTDGSAPEAALIASNGALYGTTSRGGPTDAGTVFTYNLQTNAESLVTTSMGSLPYTPVIFSKGKIYGTTSAADNGQGNIFELDPATGAAHDLYAFPRGEDQAFPGSIVKVGDILYGSAVNGGPTFNGSIFQYNLKTSTFTTLYSFTGGADGQSPNQVLYRNGALIGVASKGGANGLGAIFKFDLSTNTETVLHSFAGAADGSAPSGITYHLGHIYGTALFGGANGDGTVFTMDPSTNNVTVLYNLVGGADGCTPFGQPVLYKGLLYSAAASCGSTANQGTLFDVDIFNGKERTLHVFANGPDGVSPGGSLLLNQGVLYGTTSYGGANNSGTIFEYTP